jgi:hypothetical protein
VVINRDVENVTGRLIDETESVAFALNDIDDGPRNCGAALETTNTIDGGRVRNRNDACGNVVREEIRSSNLPPVTDLNDLVTLGINSFCYSDRVE